MALSARTLLGLLFVSTVGHAGSRCADVEQRLRARLANEQKHVIRLGTPPIADGEASCGRLEGRPDTDGGTVSGRATTVRSVGPEGSGRYWDLRIAVGDKGACLMTSTGAFRNLPNMAIERFGYWKKIVDDRLVIWSELELGNAITHSLLLPLVYEAHDEGLVLDRVATIAAIGRFAGAYEKTARDKADEAKQLHVDAAAAYRAVASDAHCN